MSASTLDTTAARDTFDRLLVQLRPKLHRYCARMTGSVIDGEDVVQEALVKAIAASPERESITDPESWLFRIAHNAALDFLRGRDRQNAIRSNEDVDMIIDPLTLADNRMVASASLRTFMRLPVAQRSCVILMDVLGYSLQEIAGVVGSSVPVVKSALHRGRTRLRELAQEPDDLALPVLAEPERSLLIRYVDHFNARDFDAIRNMIADEVRLELVDRTRMNGRREVGNYFHNYAGAQDWHFVAGLVDRRPAVLVHTPGDPLRAPLYFVLVEWAGGRVVNIRDFRYARYVTEGAEVRNSG
jgi:RNA polymerase sigma-70 factor (ECF subfamily)